MTIIQLEYLVAVANYGSFSLASQHCFVTQPSLSMQIKNLEEELGVILLDRSKKPVIPTEAGVAVIAQAKEAIKAFYTIPEVVGELKGEISGTLRLGVIPTIAPYLLHRFIPHFAHTYPKVELVVQEMTTAQLVQALNQDQLDVAIVAGGVVPEQIQEVELFNDRFYAYLSSDHDLLERSNIRIEEINLRKLLLLSDGHCLREQVIELCQARQRLSTPYHFESGSLETLMRMVDHNSQAITIIPEMALPFITKEHTSQVKPLAKGATSRKITLAMRRTYVKASIIEALRESITTCYQAK